MREFFVSRVVNGSAIPKDTQLRDHSLDVYELEKEELKQKIKEANVAIMVDKLLQSILLLLQNFGRNM